MKFSDAQLALMVLVDRGSSPEEAAMTLVNNSEAVGPAQIEAKRAALEAQEREAREQAIAESPEGRRRAALTAATEAEERSRLAGSARTLLASEGWGEAAAELSDDEALHHSGIDKKTALLTRAERDAAAEALAQKVARGQVDEATLYAEAQAVGSDPRSIVSYARNFLGGGEAE
jgi:hypothetical protein